VPVRVRAKRAQTACFASRRPRVQIPTGPLSTSNQTRDPASEATMGYEFSIHFFPKRWVRIPTGPFFFKIVYENPFCIPSHRMTNGLPELPGGTAALAKG